MKDDISFQVFASLGQSLNVEEDNLWSKLWRFLLCLCSAHLSLNTDFSQYRQQTLDHNGCNICTQQHFVIYM